MRRCKYCGGIGAAHTSQISCFGGSKCYIRCEECGYTTNTYEAFWASDARAKADKEWESKIKK